MVDRYYLLCVSKDATRTLLFWNRIDDEAKTDRFGRPGGAVLLDFSRPQQSGTGGIPTLFSVEQAIRTQLELPPMEIGPATAQQQRHNWGFFTPIEGFRLSGSGVEGNNSMTWLMWPENDHVGGYLVIEGGLYVPPAVRVGHIRFLPLPTDLTHADMETRNLAIRTESIFPLVFTVKNFLSIEECHHFVEEAKPNMDFSQVQHYDTNDDTDSAQWRTSTNAFLGRGSSTIIRKVEERVRATTSVPMVFGAPIQVISYQQGQRYDAHYDYFDSKLYGENSEIHTLTSHGKHNRFATAFFYLNNVDSGGETCFPMAGGWKQITNFNCPDQGLKIKPKLGSLLLFYNMRPNGDLDERSLHGGCAVIEGHKWAANKVFLDTNISSLHPSLHPSIHPFIHPSIHSFIHSFIHSYNHPYIHFTNQPCAHAYMHLLI